MVAPTGVAAFNIEGQTIHSKFKMANYGKKYVPLSEKTILDLSSQMENLQILVIDEISMCNHNMMNFLSGRLSPIKRSQLPFGAISVLAVGDFFQLPPVCGTALYHDSNSHDSAWEDFQMFELLYMGK